MSFRTEAAALETLLSGVSGAGQVHVGDLHVRDESRLKTLFRWLGIGEAQAELRGWRIIRDQIREEWSNNAETKSRSRYVLRAIRGIEGRLGSESRFQAMLDDVHAALRGITSVAEADVLTSPSTPTFGWAEYGEATVHYAEIEVQLTQMHTIGSAVVSVPPPATGATVGAREKYAVVANQFATVLGSVDGIGRIHEDRPLLVDEQAQRSALVIDRDGVRELSAWQIYRDTDIGATELGLGHRSSASWRLAGFLGWQDAADSYGRFQEHIDAVRAAFRTVGNLGSIRNSTAAISSPLQVREIGGRMLTGVLCHFADCEVEIEEVVHA